MKKILLLSLVIAFSTFLVNAQTESTDSSVVFDVVEQWPEYPGGDNAMSSFMSTNLVYPKQAKKQGIQGKVWISFIVNKDGSITDVTVLRGIGGGCDEEAVRVIKLMPNWIPGKQSGYVVKVKYKFPIQFTLR